jgi:hypothetical protein
VIVRLSEIPNVALHTLSTSDIQNMRIHHLVKEVKQIT